MEAKINEILFFIQGLSHDELMMIAVIAAALILFVVYRRFGLMAASGLILIYGIAYILYSYDFINVYDKRESEKNEHLKVIQEELEKD